MKWSNALQSKYHLFLDHYGIVPMKKFIILMPLFIIGCSSARYPNWEYVRIEHQIPNLKCEYKIQEACSLSGAGCYSWYKKRATMYDANTVVLTETSKDVSGYSQSAIYQGTGSSSSGFNTNLTALADYYHCKK